MFVENHSRHYDVQGVNLGQKLVKTQISQYNVTESRFFEVEKSRMDFSMDS